MKQLLFATSNQHKLREVKDILFNLYEVIGLNDIGHTDELAEDGVTLEENAIQKARFIKQTYGLDCFSEDTGLEVEALNNEPGVYSARYAGGQRSHSDNINLLLDKLKGETNRKARFRAVIALIIDQEEYLFEGIVNGNISEEVSGKGGFGYDPVFIPEGYSETFGQLPEEVKNIISHRSDALKKMIVFLNEL